ncbi:MAG: hypothetical protein LIO93_04115 [Bacteroidales bacterium]|nr:hypothetical protein [Bacteroidales bacterium]
MAQTDSQTKDSLESETVPYFPIQNGILEGSICRLHFFPEERVEEFFKEFTPTIVPEYFLLGAFGSKKIQPESNRSDTDEEFYKKTNQYPIVIFLRKYIRQTLGIEISLGEDERGVLTFHSPKLAEIINDFFDEETGELKSGIFNTSEELCSYLAAAYYRGGKKVDYKILLDTFNYEKEKNVSTYQFSHFEIHIDKLAALLREACCNNILYTSSTIRGWTPGRTSLYFEPSIYLEKYFEWIDPEKEKLDEYRMAEYEKFLLEEEAKRSKKKEKKVRENDQSIR